MTVGAITLLIATIVATYACTVQIHAGFEHAEMAWLSPVEGVARIYGFTAVDLCDRCSAGELPPNR